MFLAKERVRDPADGVMEVRHRDAARNASRRVGFRMVVVAEEIEYRTDSMLCTSDKMARACYGVGATLGRIRWFRVPSLKGGLGCRPAAHSTVRVPSLQGPLLCVSMWSCFFPPFFLCLFSGCVVSPSSCVGLFSAGRVPSSSLLQHFSLFVLCSRSAMHAFGS